MNVLAIGAHPDDAELGCGGSLVRHHRNGDTVRILHLSMGPTSRLDIPGDEVVAATRHRMSEAARVLGAEVEAEDLPDNEFDTIPLIEIVRAIESELQCFEPAVVYTHHLGDLNIDHAITARAVMTALRPTTIDGILRVLAFEVPSATECAPPGHVPFVPNVFRFLCTEDMDKKLLALECYEDEMREAHHPRSAYGVETLARYRGSACGWPYAEAFMLLRGME